MTTQGLETLDDAGLHGVIKQAQVLLKRRDEERKAKAMADAKRILEAVGLTLHDLEKKRSRKVAKSGASGSRLMKDAAGKKDAS